MIQINSLQFQLGHKTLLDKADLRVYSGNKLGIIGSNGCGKSSLFKLLLKEYKEDSGDIQIPSNWRISHMAQEVSASDETALDYALSGDDIYRKVESEISLLLEHETTQENGELLATAYSKMEAIDGYSAPARAQRLLSGLGFKSEDSTRLVSDFSGGWRIRLNLARALMCPSDLLLLDEPTNHLDLDATLWLEEWLQAYTGTLLIISHDRDFLDNIVEGIINIHQQKIESYTGNYSSYEIQKAERLSQQASAFTKQQERIAEIEGFVRRFKAKASKAKQAQSRVKELERMEKIAPAHVDSPFTFRFPQPERLPQTLINLSDASIGYKNTENKVLAKNIEFAILGTTRIGLLGHNGAGKSTLIKTLANDLPLLSGDKIESPHLNIGYFAQHQLEALDLTASCALHLQRLSENASEQEIRNFLGSFGFQGDRAFECIEHFSGGEKARLALAIVCWQKPNLLILDEPTNHLDLEMRHALTLAIQEFEGALVLVSHDRHLLKNAVDQYVLVHDGKIENFDGTLGDYQTHLIESGNPASEEESKSDALLSNKGKSPKKQDKQKEAEIRKKLKPYKQELNLLEKNIEKLGKKLQKIDEELADPELYETNAPRLQELLKLQGETRKQVDHDEEQWLEKSESLEALKDSF